MHGHHAHRVDGLGLERRLSLARVEDVAFGDGVHEAARSRPSSASNSGHAHELSHVGHAPDAAGQAEQVTVVAGGRDGTVDQRLQRHLGAHPALGLQPLHDCREPAAVALGQELQELGVGLGDRPPDVALHPPACSPISATPSSDRPPSGDASTE